MSQNTALLAQSVIGAAWLQWVVLAMGWSFIVGVFATFRSQSAQRRESARRLATAAGIIGISTVVFFLLFFGTAMGLIGYIALLSPIFPALISLSLTRGTSDNAIGAASTPIPEVGSARRTTNGALFGSCVAIVLFVLMIPGSFVIYVMLGLTSPVFYAASVHDYMDVLGSVPSDLFPRSIPPDATDVQFLGNQLPGDSNLVLRCYLPPAAVARLAVRAAASATEVDSGDKLNDMGLVCLSIDRPFFEIERITLAFKVYVLGSSTKAPWTYLYGVAIDSHTNQVIYWLAAHAS
jgi:hypothetical protein